MAEPALRRYSLSAYHAIEEETGVRHEYLNGQVMAMAGGTVAHARLCSIVLVALTIALRGPPCQVFPSELKLHMPATGLHTYADVAVVCGPVEVAAVDENAVTNPEVICEVLSPKTEAYDRGEKFDHYKRIPTLKDYILVASERQAIDHYTRNADDTWTRHGTGPGESIRLLSHDVTLSVDEIYAGVELAARKRRKIRRRV